MKKDNFEEDDFNEPCNHCIHRYSDPDREPCKSCIHSGGEEE